MNYDYFSKCYDGLKALEGKGINFTIDKDLEIDLDDPLGLYIDVCKLQNRCALQGTFQFKPKSPQAPALFIDDNNMGSLEYLKIPEIISLAKPSPFGLGSQTVYDETVRKALEITGDRIKVKLTCPKEIQQMAPFGYRIEAKLYKLTIYEKDGFFAEHADTQHGADHLGTLVICLPVEHEGGEFILFDDGNELKLPFDELVKDGEVPWVAFYSDVKHKVEVVKSGVRMTLQYDLMAQKIDEEEELDLTKEIQSKAFKDPKGKYHFVDYNQESLDLIKAKLDKWFGRKSEEKASPSKKRGREENEEQIQAENTKQTKITNKEKSEPKKEPVKINLNRTEDLEKEIIMTNRGGKKPKKIWDPRF